MYPPENIQEWIKHQIEKIATHFITKSNVDDVISVIKQAFEDSDYGKFEAKDMQFTEQLDKNPNQYIWLLSKLVKYFSQFFY